MGAHVTHPLLVRRDAAQATLDHFVDQPFEWGKYDCGRMLTFHLRQLGHRVRLARGGQYRTALGAKRTLARMGYASIAALLDERYPRIAPAETIVGDIMAFPSTGPLDAMAICLGNGRVLTYRDGINGAFVGEPVEMVAAWDVAP